ncbi:MAG: flagellar motor protein MotB [Betaproteobacteria bacterium]|nr:flagellar motor protein MotB [Betaproteobacteria bacterium]
MKNNLIGVAMAASVGLATFAASAEEMYRGAWYAVPGVSYLNTDSDLEADKGAGGFISIGKELSKRWDIQGRLGYHRADENTDFANIGGRYKQTTLSVDALYMLRRDQFRPFLLAGLGVARNDVDYTNPADGKKTSWLAGVGLGAQYLLNDSFGLQVDLRHQWSRAKLGFNNNTLGSNTTETVGNTLFNLGGIFRFSAPAPMPAAAVEPEPAPVASAPVAALETAPAPAPEPSPTSSPVPAPEPVACKPQVETVTVGAEKLFGFDQAQLKEEGKAALDEAAAKIKANPEIRVVIVTGHTDRIGSEDYNQKLSERRAKKVTAYLVNQGVAKSIIEVVGKGESEPVVQCTGNKVTNKLIDCLQPNRRVEIRAEGTKQVGCH